MKVSKRGILSALSAVAMVGMLAACSSGGGAGNGNNAEHKAQEQDTNNLVGNLPVPVYDFSWIRAALIDVEDLQAEGKQTTAFFFLPNVAKPIFTCAAVGQPIPVTAQLTNPQQNYNSRYPNGGTSYPISQMDPNGIYTSPDSAGTNVVCIDPATGVKYVHYWEGLVDDVAGPAKWDDSKQQIVLTGAPLPIQHTSSHH